MYVCRKFYQKYGNNAEVIDLLDESTDTNCQRFDHLFLSKIKKIFHKIDCVTSVASFAGRWLKRWTRFMGEGEKQTEKGSDQLMMQVVFVLDTRTRSGLTPPDSWLLRTPTALSSTAPGQLHLPIQVEDSIATALPWHLFLFNAGADALKCFSFCQGLWRHICI